MLNRAYRQGADIPTGPTSLPDFDLGPSNMIEDVQTATVSNSNWETRCLRKHRRRADDEGCSAKKRRLMFEAEVAPSNLSTSTECDWSGANSCSPQSAQQACPAAPQSCTTSKNTTLPQTSSSLFRLETESSCMEIEAAQRKLQEIEDRITLEDDEDEDLDVEPAPRRPVLVMSDSLKKGLQQGISDILPHTVAQSVSRSCMELVLWRPPEDPFSQRLKDSLQKQRKQQTACRQTPTPCPSPSPHSPLNPSSPPADTHSPLYSFSVAHNSGEEEMEM
ncbi:coiled-coil domain-containing protein 117 isoform X2 [Oreochromis aureus]|uniref:coiled-coil domain-containing protein 117 isoform X2 n=1 Tax=Oreochromis aureus TaxID=47969 RepID=UPI001953ADBD|nr:coiled-coil domain-containing protein 117 isoform X2 [Oreochromis aureus]